MLMSAEHYKFVIATLPNFNQLTTQEITKLILWDRTMIGQNKHIKVNILTKSSFRPCYPITWVVTFPMDSLGHTN